MKLVFLNHHSVGFNPSGVSVSVVSPGLYLHNYSPIKDDPLFLPQFAEQISRPPVFTADDVPELTTFLNERIHSADSGEVSAKVEQSQYRPSKKLLDHVAKLIKGKSEYVLLDEQLVVTTRLWRLQQRVSKERRKLPLSFGAALHRVSTP